MDSGFDGPFYELDGGGSLFEDFAHSSVRRCHFLESDAVTHFGWVLVISIFGYVYCMKVDTGNRVVISCALDRGFLLSSLMMLCVVQRCDELLGYELR